MFAKTNHKKNLKAYIVAITSLLVLVAPMSAYAASLARIPTPPPESDSYGLEATKTQPPPTEGASISIPSDGASFTTSPTTVSGICPSNLLVEVYDNNVMVGAITCNNGSFSVSITLFDGANALTASDYDNLSQSGPATNTVTVNYNDAKFSAFGDLITLTSSYGREAATVGSTLSWPVLLSGGNGPYAFSINWGDSSTNELKSEPLAGTITLDHIYSKAGIYHVSIEVTDVNGVTAFLQLVAVANGNSLAGTTNVNSTTKTSGSSGATTGVSKVLWAPTIVVLVLSVPIYWLGRKSQLVALRKRLDKEMQAYNQDSQTEQTPKEDDK